jgi:cytochrome P450
VSEISAQRPVPGPASWLPGKWFLDFSRDPLTFFAESQRAYGDIVRFTFGRHQFFLVSHPDWIEEVLVTSKKFGRGEIAKRLFGAGMISLNGQEHLKRRRTIQPLFHRRYVHGFAAAMVRQGERWRDRFTPDGVVDMTAAMRDLTFAVVCETLFSSDGEGQGNAIGEAFLEGSERFGVAFVPGIRYLEKLPLPPFVRMRRARERLEGGLDRVIADRRAGDEQPDLISMLMAARDPENPSEPGMTDRQIRDEALTIFIAGHDTSANALAWTWHLLDTAPAAEARLHEELDRVLAGRTPAVDDVPKLEYTRAVVAEAMRLYSPAWTLGRRVLETHTLGDHALDAGSVVFVSQWVAHRDPRWWDAPEVFRPERWMDGSTRPKYAYFPFGGGVHLCVGEAFAWTELVLVLATIAQRWRFATVSAPTPEPRITLRPKGLRMRALRRQLPA